MYGTILTFIKFNNFGTQRLNGPRHSFHSFCCRTWCILFEPLRVYEPSFNMDKYGNRFHSLIYWLLMFNCSIITYFIAVNLEKSL